MESCTERILDEKKNQYTHIDEENNIYKHFNFEEKIKLIFSKSKTYIHEEFFTENNNIGYVILIEKIPKQQLTTAIHGENISLLWVPNSIIISSNDYEIYKMMDSNNYDNKIKDDIYIKFNPLNFHKHIRFISLLKIQSILVKPPSKNKNQGSITINAYGKREAFKESYKQIRWNILEHFSRITTFSREKTKNILDKSFAKRSFLSNFHPKLQKFMNSENTVTTIEEYNMARLYLARWAARIAEDSERDKHNKIIRNNKDADTWSKETSFIDFEVPNLNTFENNIQIQHHKPISEKQWKSWFNYEGRLSITEEKIKEAIFYKSVHPSIRKEVWCFLLEIYPWDSSSEERETIFSKKCDEYMELKQKWQNNKRQNIDDTFDDQKHQIEKDVRRTDKQTHYFSNDIIVQNTSDSYLLEGNPHLETIRNILLTYNEYNKALGYVQVWFKREFEWDDILQLWERLWTDHISYHLKDFDEVLKYINDLSMSIDLESTLQRAKNLFYKFQEILKTIDTNSSTKTISFINCSKKKENDNAESDINALPIRNSKLPLVSNCLKDLLDSNSTI
ncbi:hypothetical protein PMAC_002605 [Pneumocystis sp. 'macacae']|nr:hypothetical protein PMAC_002605 [Pneumocystis sp. 'macacae']